MRRDVRHTPYIWWLVIIVSVGISISYANTAPKNAGQPTEYEVKAAFLFNFAKFVEWPVSALVSTDSVLIIGVLAPEDVVDVFKEVIGQKVVKNRRILIRQYYWYRDIEFCHILFVGNNESKRLPRILNFIKNKPILTVGDQIEGFAEAGGIINFVLNDKLVNFEINPTAAKRLDIQISSKLLRLATIVDDDQEARE
ncbi:YfiR family protein [candidate division KSB1 bacterium]|nr:YfiR family protein [candidate division KSB1 bacterium]